MRRNKTEYKFSRESSSSGQKHYKNKPKNFPAASWVLPAIWDVCRRLKTRCLMYRSEIAGRTQPAADRFLVCIFNVFGQKKRRPLKICILSCFIWLKSIHLNLLWVFETVKCVILCYFLGVEGKTLILFPSVSTEDKSSVWHLSSSCQTRQTGWTSGSLEMLTVLLWSRWVGLRVRPRWLGQFFLNMGEGRRGGESLHLSVRPSVCSSVVLSMRLCMHDSSWTV